MSEDAARPHETVLAQTFQRILPVTVLAHLAVGGALGQVHVDARVVLLAEFAQQFQGSLLEGEAGVGSDEGAGMRHTCFLPLGTSGQVTGILFQGGISTAAAAPVGGLVTEASAQADLADAVLETIERLAHAAQAGVMIEQQGGAAADGVPGSGHGAQVGGLGVERAVQGPPDLRQDVGEGAGADSGAWHTSRECGVEVGVPVDVAGQDRHLSQVDHLLAGSGSEVGSPLDYALTGHAQVDGLDPRRRFRVESAGEVVQHVAVLEQEPGLLRILCLAVLGAAVRAQQRSSFEAG